MTSARIQTAGCQQEHAALVPSKRNSRFNLLSLRCLTIRLNDHRTRTPVGCASGLPVITAARIGIGAAAPRLHPCHTIRHAGPHRAVQEVELSRVGEGPAPTRPAASVPTGSRSSSPAGSCAAAARPASFAVTGPLALPGSALYPQACAHAGRTKRKRAGMKPALWNGMVETRRIELPTSALRTPRSPI